MLGLWLSQSRHLVYSCRSRLGLATHHGRLYWILSKIHKNGWQANTIKITDSWRISQRGVLEVTLPCNDWKTHPAGVWQLKNRPVFMAKLCAWQNQKETEKKGGQNGQNWSFCTLKHQKLTRFYKTDCSAPVQMS